MTDKLVSGLKYLMGLQLATRMATFALNTAVLRHVEPAVFGAAMQMQTITNLALFVSREALRRTYIRSPNVTTRGVREALRFFFKG